VIKRGAWEADDLAQWIVMSVVGALVVFAGWFILSSRDTFASEIPGLDVAIVGVLLFGYAQASFVLRGYRIIEHRSVSLFRAARSGRSALDPRDTNGTSGDLVAVDGLRYFHRPSCPLVQGKAHRSLTLPLRSGEHRACPVCQP
jgi:hypothetical protein